MRSGGWVATPQAPEAPPAQPREKPAPAPGPVRERPAPRPERDPFNPDWPRTRPLPEPKG